jgi:predicted GNAT family N-acyltransferase
MTLDTEISRDLGPEDMDRAFAIRLEVFVREQGIPADTDFDNKDRQAHHVLVSSAGSGVATGRVLVSDSGEAVLARIAVLPDFRGHGLGRIVVRELEAIAVEAGATSFRLHPHHYLEQFYEDLGYTTVPGVDSVGGHQLITMTKRAR